MAEQIRTLLNSARRSEAAQKEIGEKLDQILKQTNRETIPPTVGLRFVYPESPSLVIANPSAGIARDIKYTVALWNMDLPDRNDPLPIPIASFDWIRPNDEGGPQNLFGSPQVATLLKHGDHLFGSAAVICPECTRGRTYIVYIVWGQSGWYSEIENELSGRVFTPQNFLRPARETYFKQLETMAPSQTRIPIGNP
ncbi:MAG TPA: hypothetical protein VMT67_10340 [Terriglobales bacterium]|nr:hypothetical protein [Terriglobales bacterium]